MIPQSRSRDAPMTQVRDVAKKLINTGMCELYVTDCLRYKCDRLWPDDYIINQINQIPILSDLPSVGCPTTMVTNRATLLCQCCHVGFVGDYHLGLLTRARTRIVFPTHNWCRKVFMGRGSTPGQVGQTATSTCQLPLFDVTRNRHSVPGHMSNKYCTICRR